MLTKAKLIRAYDKGQVDEVRKELQRYGTITRDKEWSEADGYYAGAHRVQHITHHGLQWELRLWNGETHRVGYKLAE